MKRDASRMTATPTPAGSVNATVEKWPSPIAGTRG